MSERNRSGDRPIRRRPSAQRLRAARAFSGLERREFGERTGLSVERLNYLENGKGNPDPQEVEVVARVSGAPLWFLQGGFDGRPEVGSLDERVERLERRLEELALRPAASDAPGPPGELGRALSTERPTAPDPPRTENPAEEEIGA